jgi:hypothetical protein
MDVFKTLILDTPDSLENISGVLPVVNGGTGADNAPDARVNLLPNYTGNANKVLSLNGTATDVEWTSNGAGDVAGPASSTDNAVVRFDSTTGKLIQNSGVTISDADLLTTTDLTVNDNTTLGSSNTDTVNFNARVASDINPATDNTYDLGVTGHEWRNLNIDGTANIDSLVADTADINGGTIDGTTIGAGTPSTGQFTTLGVGTPAGTNVKLATAGAGLTGTSQFSHTSFVTATSDATVGYLGYVSNISTEASAFTMTDMTHFRAGQGTIGIGSTVTNQTGYLAMSSMTGATKNYGFRGQIAAAANRYNLYMDGTAQNYFAGNVGIGTAGPNSKLEVAGVTTNNDGIRLEGSGSNLRLMIQNASGITGERAFSLTNNSAVKGLLFQALDNSYNFVRNVAMFGHDGNVGIGTTDQFGGGVKVVGLANATTAPSTNPTGGGVLYVESGALKYRGSSGTVTTIANA